MTSTHLGYEVFVAPPIPIVPPGPPPQGERAMWSPISATLITGRRDAVLVDPLLTGEQGDALADWVAARGKNLTTVYVTHGHGDHWFGLARILERFPTARALATTQVVEHMNRSRQPEALAAFWEPLLPGQIPKTLVIAEPLDEPSFQLEGEDLVAVELGHTDTDFTTCLHVPSIGLVVAGDAAYNDVHQYLIESDHEGREQWIAAIDTIAGLQPRAVIAGHKRAERSDDPAILDETRQYLRDFDRIAESAAHPRQLYDGMVSLYPNRLNRVVLWASALTVLPAESIPA